jgi:hypothetical protein
VSHDEAEHVELMRSTEALHLLTEAQQEAVSELEAIETTTAVVRVGSGVCGIYVVV